ncbi:MAG: hypothetical protein HY870_24155, partial [Chloroflexi bacterium]|nr:hypothetical protein [Chloroflexota bacterium]
LAYSNSRHYAILIPTSVKREVIGKLRQAGLSRSLAAIRVFAASLWLLLAEVIDEATDIRIDPEYAGHEGDIKAALLRAAQHNGRKVEPHTILFGQIGKLSRAHECAINVYRGWQRPDRVITAADLRAVLRQQK